ncbi:hypothetical protein F4779DRAFT_576459 [Xylariaceae sp. FL0662B]|nr:hypothetical protein F4779DRAFT_576459 [Xylariaceae sp. FL0662B]
MAPKVPRTKKANKSNTATDCGINRLHAKTPQWMPRAMDHLMARVGRSDLDSESDVLLPGRSQRDQILKAVNTPSSRVLDDGGFVNVRGIARDLQHTNLSGDDLLLDTTTSPSISGDRKGSLDRGSSRAVSSMSTVDNFAKLTETAKDTRYSHLSPESRPYEDGVTMMRVSNHHDAPLAYPRYSSQVSSSSSIGENLAKLAKDAHDPRYANLFPGK